MVISLLLKKLLITKLNNLTKTKISYRLNPVADFFVLISTTTFSKTNLNLANYYSILDDASDP